MEIHPDSHEIKVWLARIDLLSRAEKSVGVYTHLLGGQFDITEIIRLIRSYF